MPLSQAQLGACPGCVFVQEMSPVCPRCTSTRRTTAGKAERVIVLLQPETRHPGSFEHIPQWALMIGAGWPCICILIKINESCMIQQAVLAVGRGAGESYRIREGSSR